MGLRPIRCKFFFTLSLVILKILRGLNLYIRALFEKCLALKLKLPKNSFETATLKHCRTANTHQKVTINSSF